MKSLPEMKQLELFRQQLDVACEEVRAAVHVAVECPSPRKIKRLVRKVRTANQQLHTLARAEQKGVRLIIKIK